MIHLAALTIHTVAEYLPRDICRVELASRLLRYLTHFSNFAALCLAIGLSSTVLEARASIYYVDPVAGNDSNAGTSQRTPWKTIPGTRTSNDSGFLRRAWGSILPSNPIKAADIIEVKAGTSMTLASGGRLQIDANFYQNGTAANPIVIRISSSWGTGNFTYNASGMTVPRYYAAVTIVRRNYIQIRGAGASRRFSIVNTSGGGWGIMAFGSNYNKQVGVVLDYLELAKNSYGGSTICGSDNWTISNSISHNNGSVGFETGCLDDSNANNGLYSDDEAYMNGDNPTSGIAHGFALSGATNITFLRCKSHNNVRDGFDFGTVTNTNNASAMYINSLSYNNGEDGFGCNGGHAGVQSANYINVISFNNRQSGWYIYDGPTVGIYHSIAHANGPLPGNNFSGNILTSTGMGSLVSHIKLRNNIFYKPINNSQIGNYDVGALPVIDSDYNIYVPRSSNTETFSDFPIGNWRSYKNPPSFVGAHDKLGIEYDPGFASASSTTNFLANNYHLTSASSPAIRAGIQVSSITLGQRLLNDTLAKDLDGNSRSLPPDIGAYQFSTSLKSPLQPPLNVLIQP